MNSELFTVVTKHPAYLRLQEVAKLMGPESARPGALFSDAALGRDLLTLLQDCHMSLKDFEKSTGIKGNVLDGITKGQFTQANTGKLLEALTKLAPKLNDGLNQHRIEWVSLQSGEVKKLVGRIRKPLEDLCTLLRESNLAGSEASIITEAQRVQLIALLKALMVELEGDYIERGRVKNLTAWLSRILQKAGEGALQETLTGGLTSGWEALKTFGFGLSGLPSKTFPDDSSTET